jgi:hypothetical protein
MEVNMKLKKIAAIVLIAFVVTSLAYMLVRETTAESAANEPAGTMVPNAAAPDDKPRTQTIVYYFHGDARCPTCYKLEAYAKEALDTHFSDELAAGQIVWQVVNVDQPQNAHYIQDYKLVTKSVVLSSVANGKEAKWENLDRVWQEVGDKQAYLEYVRDSIVKFRE